VSETALAAATTPTRIIHRIRIIQTSATTVRTTTAIASGVPRIGIIDTGTAATSGTNATTTPACVIDGVIVIDASPAAIRTTATVIGTINRICVSYAALRRSRRCADNRASTNQCSAANHPAQKGTAINVRSPTGIFGSDIICHGSIPFFSGRTIRPALTHCQATVSRSACNPEKMAQ
jgi:hypothetical protein